MIKTNEEIQKIRGIKNTIKINPGSILTFENSDPCFYADEIIDSLDMSDIKNILHYSPYDYNGSWKPKKIEMLYLITKQINDDIIRLLKLNIPKFLSVSITGMGGTKIEPYVENYKETFKKINNIIKLGMNPEDIIIRIDPLYPGINTPDVNEKLLIDIIKKTQELNIKQIYTSMFDIYSNTSKEILSLINMNVYSDKNKTDKNTLHANKDYIYNMFKKLSKLIKNYSNCEMILCGEYIDVIPKNCKYIGCLNLERIEKTLCNKVTGIKDRKHEDISIQRDNCLCVITDNNKKVKRQGLNDNHTCFHACLGCYMKY